MAPLFENPKLDRDLKAMVHEVFGEFLTAKDGEILAFYVLYVLIVPSL